MDHDIPLDALLSDAAEVLRSAGANALAHAIEIARSRLDQTITKNDTDPTPSTRSFSN